MGKTAQNTRILVNWTTRQIIHTNYHEGSDEYKALIQKGYVKVGQIRGEVIAYWESEYFDPKDKYGESPNIETITT